MDRNLVMPRDSARCGWILVSDHRHYGWGMIVTYLPTDNHTFGASGCNWLVPGTMED